MSGLNWIWSIDIYRQMRAGSVFVVSLSRYTYNCTSCQPQMTLSLLLSPPSSLPPSLPPYLLVILSEGLGLDNVGHVKNLGGRWKKRRECWTRRYVGWRGGGREGGRGEWRWSQHEEIVDKHTSYGQ